jgi:NAD+ synthetase
MLHEELLEVLHRQRLRRHFDPQLYVDAKSRLVNEYFGRCNIRGCVIGVSGGIDSAVALGLLRRIAERENSPIRRVVPALIPMFSNPGTTNQSQATERGREVAESFGFTSVLVDLSNSLAAVREAIEGPLGTAGQAWAVGQLVSYLRTPALYYLAPLLTQDGDPAVVCGTTNRDEGSYIGFFGKASDAMVDVQLISDLHKSEVFTLAKWLGVPESVIRATPTGDTFDGRVDEDLIGAPYDFVELYEAFLCLPEAERERITSSLGPAARQQFDTLAARIEMLHRQNLHKYNGGGSTAVHLDVHERVVPGGWRREPQVPFEEASFWRFTDEEMWGPIIGRFDLDPAVVEAFRSGRDLVLPRVHGPEAGLAREVLFVDNLISDEEARLLEAEVMQQEQTTVGYDGRLKNYDPERDAVGSRRVSCLAPELADELWRRLEPVFPVLRIADQDALTDWKGHEVWRAVGINPLLRFLRYEKDGRSSGHYDLGYDAGDGRQRSLMSIVIYLTDRRDNDGGATILLLDRQRHVPLDDWDYSDQIDRPQERDILLRSPPRAGSAFVFDHFLLHAAETWNSSSHRLILRTDVMFERCGIDALAPRLAPSLAPSLALIPRAVEAADQESHERESLWQVLGVSRDATQREIDRAGAQALAKASSDAEIETVERAWRILGDRYYRGCYARSGSLEILDRAGYFDDGRPPAHEDPRAAPEWMVTPLHHLSARLEQVEAEARAGEAPPSLAVLLMTGALCPVHRGHLELMDAARRALEARGVVVLGGYVSPSHDQYVEEKHGSEAVAAEHRLHLCEAAVRDSDWLMVDPWEALHCSGPVNFTEVMSRLEAYLSAHLRCSIPIRVVYAFGSDRADFALAFAAQGGGVCIRRPGYDRAFAAAASHPLVAGNQRVVFVDEAETSEATSTSIRAGTNPVAMPEEVRKIWSTWRAPVDGERGSLRLLVRDEGDWALEPWLELCSPDMLRSAQGRLWQGLEAALAKAYGEVSRPDEGRELIVERRPIDAQVREFERRDGVASISIDPCLVGDFQLACSRCFELSAPKLRRALVSRPGHPSLDEQIEAIPAGAYVLTDDDTASGQTLRDVAGLLPERCQVIDTQVLIELAALNEAAARTGDVVDLIDARDFIVGARDAGLVVGLPDGGHARVPYALPYMRPHDHYSIPLANELRLSREIWRLNAEFFEAITPALKVRDANIGFRALCDYLGFGEDTPLAEVCTWHLERLG